MKTSFTNYYNPPKAKMMAPTTSSQEVGWNNTPLISEQFKDHKRLECKETSFGSNYMFMKGHSLYSNKNQL